MAEVAMERAMAEVARERVRADEGMGAEGWARGAAAPVPAAARAPALDAAAPWPWAREAVGAGGPPTLHGEAVILIGQGAGKAARGSKEALLASVAVSGATHSPAAANSSAAHRKAIRAAIGVPRFSTPPLATAERRVEARAGFVGRRSAAAAKSME